jgi:glucan 1,3-beta-glucosidase
VAKEVIPAVDFATADVAEIEALFELFGNVEYDVHDELRSALTAAKASMLYTLPTPPEGLLISVDPGVVSLSWNANPEYDVTGYNLYRSDGNNLNFRLLAENLAALSYQDTIVDDSLVYFYHLVAVDGEDISYPSAEVATGAIALTIPGRIEAELFSRNVGFQIESTSDAGGGANTGFADEGDYLEYDVTIAKAGTYTVSYRLASLPGSQGFTLSNDDNVIDTVVLAATGGWQSWVTISSTVDLPAGEQTLRFDSVGREWNMNWFEFE